jgi:hypothetical protein
MDHPTADKKPQWHETRLGITYALHPDGQRYCALVPVGPLTQLKLWTRGGGFNPPQYTFADSELARRHGEAWWHDPSILPSSSYRS